MNSVRADKHLDFVSNCVGGSMVEVIGLFTIAVAISYLKCKLQHLFFLNAHTTSLLIFDLLFLLMAFVLPCTLLSNYITETVLLVSSSVIIVYLKSNASTGKPPLPNTFSLSAWRRFLRSLILIYTCVCIYAVDFPIFPRRFAKTEVTGVSLMDTGVGLVAISLGISNITFVTACKERQSGVFKVIVKSTLPCILLGASRTFTIKALGYPDHVTEYGVHWNFFITLAFMRLGGFVVGLAISGMSDFNAMNTTLGLTVVTACLHHFGLLTALGWASRLASGLTSADRESSLVLANAEGLISFPGYLSLFLYGMTVAYFMRIHTDPADRGDKFKCLCVQGKETWVGDSRKVTLALAVVAAGNLLVVSLFGENSVSRTLVNLPYIALQIGLGTFLMTLVKIFICISPVSEGPTPNTPDLMTLTTFVADNTLVYFLLSNITTGILNMLVDTFDIANLQPIWFGSACQFLLLGTYAAVCPLLSAGLSSLLLGRAKRVVQ